MGISLSRVIADVGERLTHLAAVREVVGSIPVLDMSSEKNFSGLNFPM